MGNMERLTTNKPVSKMSMIELAHNSCYAKDRKARYRDFEIDVDARDFAREIMVAFGQWKSCEMYGLDADNELIDDEIFDDSIFEYLQNYPTTLTGLVALFYRNLWAMADLHARLKEYEDAEEQGLLLRLPVPEGGVVYTLSYIYECKFDYDCKEFDAYKCEEDIPCEHQYKVYRVKETKFQKQMLVMLGKTVFLTKEEAEVALAGMEKENE